MAAAAAAAFAVGDWLAVHRGSKRAEYLLKPATLVALILCASTLDPSDDARRWWFVAALVFSLAGDVFLMLPADLFVAGLASFLVGHLAYVAGWFAADVEPSKVVLFVLIVLLLTVPVLLRLIKALRSKDRHGLIPPVVVYSVAIAGMVGATVAGGIGWGIAGALLFLCSDLMIAWSRFVTAWPHHKLAIIVTYHLGQAGLITSLLLSAG